MPAGKPQIKVALGSVEVTDTDRRAIAWEYDGFWDDSSPKKWILDAASCDGTLASRDDVRRYMRKHGEHGLSLIVSSYLAAGGLTASMERERK